MMDILTLLVGALAASAPAAPAGTMLIVATGHGSLGATGRPTGAFLSEISHAYWTFRRAGLAVEIASPAGGAIPLDGVDTADADNRALLHDSGAVAALRGSRRAGGFGTGDFAGVYFAGGHGAMWDFPSDTSLQRLVRTSLEAGKPVGAVCHGVAVLADVRGPRGGWLVDGLRLTGFSDAEEKAVHKEGIVPFPLETRLVAHGARYESAPLFQSRVVTDGNLVTGQNPASSRGVAEAMLLLVEKRNASNH